MKYCVNCRQPKDVLEKVDEIYVEPRDYRIVPELFVKYPDKRIILEFNANNFELAVLQQYAEASPENFVVKLMYLNDQNLSFVKDFGIKFYYGYPISTFYELRGLQDLGVEYIFIQEPLSFEMEKLSKIDMKFRMVPNIAYAAYIPRKDGLHGQWVRPEDIKYYEDGIYVFDFEDANLEKERTLFHIYAENGCWPGNLNLLLTNFGINIDNRLFPADFGEHRSNCGQRCQSRGTCHYCDLNIRFHDMVQEHREELLERKRQKEKEHTDSEEPN